MFPRRQVAKLAPDDSVSSLTGWLMQTTGSYKAPMQVIWLFLIIGIAAYIFLVRQKYAVTLTMTRP
jgi:hypothetical protein